MKHPIAALVALLLLALTTGPLHAQGQGKDKGSHQGSQNHGQVVSECNHRANQRNLKGQDRHDYVEWCTTRGSRYRYDHDRYGKESDCYRKANNKGLTGEKRRNFLDKCFDEVAHRFSGDGKRKKD